MAARAPALHLPLSPPLEPMLAKATADLPDGEGWIYEPKWDGFRALVFRDGDELYLQSREKKPLARYFPELVAVLLAQLPPRCVLDGEIVIATPRGLDFDALQMRLHPAASRIKKLSEECPSAFVAFDLLALGDEDLTALPMAERRRRLEEVLAEARPPLHLTPATRDREVAADWFRRFEGAGLDGVIAKPDDLVYQPKKRAMLKIKHRRTADCVVCGFRWHKNGPGTLVGSLLLGLYNDAGDLHHVGVTSSFTMERRKELVAELAPLREGAAEAHPWAKWAEAQEDVSAAAARGMQSRWSQGKDLSFELLRLERVAEVAYDHLQGHRFRHAATFVRWRPDREPKSCTYEQCGVTPPYELQRIFGLTA